MREDVDSGSCGSCGYYFKNILKFLLSHIGLVSLVVGYTIVGAFLFEALEVKAEKEVKRSMKQERIEVTNQLWEITKHGDYFKEEEWSSKARKALMSFESTLITAIKERGWDGREDENDVRWTFSGALFYSIILITTIGYGHISPKTEMGKVMTIFYAIPGVPLMMLCLANIGDGMAHSFRFLYWKVCCYACTKRPKRKRKQRPSYRTPSRSRYSTPSNPNRTRPSSFRKPGRGSQRSQRSADSQLNDSYFAYSDPAYKMYDNGLDDRRSVGMSASLGRDGRLHHEDRGTKSLTGSLSRSKHGPHRTADSLSAPNKDISNVDDDKKSAVLYNKYAIEQEEISTDPRNDTRDSETKEKQLARDPEKSVERELPERTDPKENMRGRGRSGNRDRIREQESTPKMMRTPGQIRGNLQEPPMERPYRGDSGYYSRGPPDTRSRLSAMEEQYYYEDEYTDDEEDDMDMEDHSEKPVPIWLGVMLVVMYIIAGAILFNHWEEWPFLDSVYFCFITLTTIGFGDFVPAQNTKPGKSDELSIALCSLYLLFGIALLAMSFNLVQEEVISNVKTVAKRLGIIKDDEEEE